MRLASVLGILLLVSTSRAQLENFLGLNLQGLYEHVETVENAFGETLTKKLIDAVHEGIAGTFTPRRALAFVEELTEEEKDGAAQGIITLVRELEKIVSTPGTKDQLRMALELAPVMMRQVIRPSAGTTSSKEPTDHKDELKDTESNRNNVIEVVAKFQQNETTENRDDKDMDTGEIRSLLGNLTGTGKVPDDLLEVMEHLLNIVDRYEDEDMPERMALDDRSTLTSPQMNKPEEMDEIVPGAHGEKAKENEIDEENLTNEVNKNQHEPDEL